MKPTTKPRLGVLHTTITGMIIFAAAVICGYFASHYVALTLLVPLLKFTIGIIGIAWLFSLTVYNKLADVTDIPGLDFRQHRNIELEIHARLQWFWLRAIFLGLIALAIYVPTILSEAKLTIPDWVVAIAFGALALGLFSLRRLWEELEEIRELKSYVKEIERREKERAEQVKAIKEGVKDAWEPDPRLNGFRNSHPNDHK
jgi:hypothetical protein